MNIVELETLAIRLPDGTLHALGPQLCSGCGAAMPDAAAGESCWKVPGRGVFHAGCYEMKAGL